MLTDMAPTGVVLATASADGGGPRPWLVADGRALPLADWAFDWPVARVGSLTELVEHWKEHKSGLQALTALIETRDRIRLARGERRKRSVCTHPSDPAKPSAPSAITGDRSWKRRWILPTADPRRPYAKRWITGVAPANPMCA